MHSEIYTVLISMMDQGQYTVVTASQAISKLYAYQQITAGEYDALMAKAATLDVNSADGALLVRVVALERAVESLTGELAALKQAVETGSSTIPDPEPGQTGTEMDPIDAVAGMAYLLNLYYRDPTNGEVYQCVKSVGGWAGLPHEAVNIYFNWVRKE